MVAWYGRQCLYDIYCCGDACETQCHDRCRQGNDRNADFCNRLSWQKMAVEVENLKKAESKGEKNLRPSELAVTYLYICTLSGQKLTSQRKAEYDYLVNLLSKQNTGLTIAGKLMSL